MTPLRALAILLFSLASLVGFAPPALAQWDPPRVAVQIEPSEVGVGDPFVVQVQATADKGAPNPSDPRLTPPPGLTATGPSLSTQQQVSIVNGRVTQKTTVVASWRLVAAREGTFTIPSPTFSWNGGRLTGSPSKVVVHAAGFRPRTSPRAAPDPFDPFGMMPKLPGLFENPQPPQEPPPAPPELAVEVAPDPSVFLRAIVDKKSAVVGEQVTLSVYLYSRMGHIDWTDVHEPALADFLRRDLMSPSSDPEVRLVPIGNATWQAQAVFRVALFPLKTGDLTIGPMRATVTIGRGFGPRQSGPRESAPVVIRATEPPAAGRPPGYQAGDVGSFGVAASVEPRSAEVGGAVAVNVAVNGVGNVPSAIRVPMQAGVEWLEPQVRESFEVENGKVRGSRTFSYVVRPKVAGQLDLGTISLPFWNPERRAYEVARSALGTIKVAPGASPAASATAGSARDPFAAVAGPRTTLGELRAPSPPPTERPAFWLGLFGAPLAVVGGSLGVRGARGLRARWAAGRAGPAAALERALAEAAQAERAGDPKALAAAVDRAVHLAIESATGLRARALLLDELPAALEGRGVTGEVAARVRDLLATTEAARFSPADAPSLADIVQRAREATHALGRVPAAGKP